MKKMLLFLIPAVCFSSFTSQAQINTLAIDWSHFKGAKTIDLSFPKSPGNAHTRISLNQQGQVLTEESYNNAQLVAQTTYKYDQKGRVTERNKTAMIDTKSPQPYLYTYSYNSDRCEELHIAGNGTIKEKIEAILNSDGQRISETQLGEDGSNAGAYQYRYDHRGNQTEIFVLRAADDLIHAKWPDSVRINKNIIRYDEYHNPIAFESYNALGNIVGTQRFDYVFDARHNWIKRTSTTTKASGEVTSESSFELAINY